MQQGADGPAIRISHRGDEHVIRIRYVGWCTSDHSTSVSGVVGGRQAVVRQTPLHLLYEPTVVILLHRSLVSGTIN